MWPLTHVQKLTYPVRQLGKTLDQPVTGGERESGLNRCYAANHNSMTRASNSLGAGTGQCETTVISQPTTSSLSTTAPIVKTVERSCNVLSKFVVTG